MNDIGKGVLIGVFSSVIISGLGYVFLVKEHQIKIENIENLLLKYDGKMEASGDTINALKLFIVSAHPDRNYMPIASARKLEAMDLGEIAIMAASIAKVESKESWIEVVKSGKHFSPIVAEYNGVFQDSWH